MYFLFVRSHPNTRTTDGAGHSFSVGQLRKNLERENSRGDGRYQLSVSVGVAEHRSESVKSLAEMMAIADADMYEKKKARHKKKGPLRQD